MHELCFSSSMDDLSPWNIRHGRHESACRTDTSTKTRDKRQSWTSWSFSTFLYVLNQCSSILFLKNCSIAGLSPSLVPSHLGRIYLAPNWRKWTETGSDFLQNILNRAPLCALNEHDPEEMTLSILHQQMVKTLPVTWHNIQHRQKDIGSVGNLLMSRRKVYQIQLKPKPCRPDGRLSVYTTALTARETNGTLFPI